MTETQNQPNNEESVVIIGTRRDDVLYGSLGHNIFYGGLGNDTFIVNNRNDQIVERYGEGTDTVHTHTTYTLPNYVENLTMTGHVVATATIFCVAIMVTIIWKETKATMF